MLEVNNISSFDRENNEKTIVVLGPPRSGTSMISGCLKILGVFMGDSDRPNHEDRRFNHNNSSVQEIEEIIKGYNNEHSVWGWKEPSTHNYLENIFPSLVNPVFIVSCRNPYDCANSKISRTGTGDFQKLVSGVSNQYVRIVKSLEKVSAGAIYVNHEQALANPRQFAIEMANLLNIEIEEKLLDTVAEFCTPGTYKKI